MNNQPSGPPGFERDRELEEQHRQQRSMLQQQEDLAQREREHNERQERERQHREQHFQPAPPHQNNTGSIPIHQPVASRLPGAIHSPGGLLATHNGAPPPPPLGAPSGPPNAFGGPLHSDAARPAQLNAQNSAAQQQHHQMFGPAILNHNQPPSNVGLGVPGFGGPLQQHQQQPLQQQQEAAQRLMPSFGPPITPMTPGQQVPGQGALGQGGQQPILNDALSYLDQVKVQFADQPDVYNRFLDIMKDFKSQAIDTPGVINRVSELFAGHPNLIQGFNTFLPPGYRIECGTDNNPNTIRVTTPMGTTVQSITGTGRALPESTGHGGANGAFYNNRPGWQPNTQHSVESPEAVFSPANQNANSFQGQQGHQVSQQAAAEAAHQQQQRGVSQLTSAVATLGQQPPRNTQTPTPGGSNNLNGPGSQQGLEKRGPVEFNHAISYVNKIKNRFQDRPEIYKQFLEILQTYQRESKPIQDVYGQVTKLFETAPDLLEDFKQFLPESAAQAKAAAKAAAEEASLAPGPSQTPQPSTGRPGEAKMPAMGNFIPPSSNTKDNKKRKGNTAAGAVSQNVGESSARGASGNKRLKTNNNSKNMVSEAAAVSPTLTPVLPRPTSPTTTSAASSEELAFFDRVKKYIGNKSSMNEFLKLCNMFSQDLIDRNVLVHKVSNFIGSNPDLMNWFKVFVSYEGVDEIIDNQPRAPTGRVALSNCRGLGPSYRLLPKRPLLPSTTIHCHSTPSAMSQAPAESSRRTRSTAASSSTAQPRASDDRISNFRSPPSANEKSFLESILAAPWSADPSLESGSPGGKKPSVPMLNNKQNRKVADPVRSSAASSPTAQPRNSDDGASNVRSLPMANDKVFLESILATPSMADPLLEGDSLGGKKPSVPMVNNKHNRNVADPIRSSAASSPTAQSRHSDDDISNIRSLPSANDQAFLEPVLAADPLLKRPNSLDSSMPSPKAKDVRKRKAADDHPKRKRFHPKRGVHRADFLAPASENISLENTIYAYGYVNTNLGDPHGKAMAREAAESKSLALKSIAKEASLRGGKVLTLEETMNIERHTYAELANEMHQERLKTCSGRDEMCKAVLNDDWASHPTWASEDSGFIAHRKNIFEESLHRIEEERHDYDFNIEANAKVIQLLEPIGQQILALDPAERHNFRMPIGLGGQSASIYRRVLKKIYGAEKGQGADVALDLFRDPCAVLPVILARLKQKDEEWRFTQREWEKVWHAQTSAMYMKSLDHQGINIKSADKKNFAQKTLIDGIRAKAEEQRRDRATGQANVSKHQYSHDFADMEVVGNVLRLMVLYATNAPQHNPGERIKIANEFEKFISAFFDLSVDDVAKHLADIDRGTPEEYEEETEPGRGKRVNGKKADLRRGVLDKARNGTRGRGQKDDSASGSKESTPDVESVVEDDFADVADDRTITDVTNDRWATPPGPVVKVGSTPLEPEEAEAEADVSYKRVAYDLYCNPTIYHLFAVFQTLYKRFKDIKDSELEARDSVARAQSNKAAKEIGLLAESYDHYSEIEEGETYYTKTLRLVEGLILGETDQAKYEDILRRYYLRKGWQIYTVCDLLKILCRLGVACVAQDNKDKTRALLNQFYEDRAKPETSHTTVCNLRKQADKWIKDDTVLLVRWYSDQSRATAQVVQKTDTTFDLDLMGRIPRWQYYVSSYIRVEPTEGVPRKKLHKVLLRRNLPSLEDTPRKGLHMEEDLTLNICVNSYTMMYMAGSDSVIYDDKELGGGKDGAARQRLKKVEEKRNQKFRERFHMNTKWMEGMKHEEVQQVNQEFQDWIDGSAAAGVLVPGAVDVEMG